jgi:O-acetyl-ADP-ribose deacetylase (regulator of RNase III)
VVRFTQGDILKTDAEALVNTVNCVGVMGRGIALQFKHAFPANFDAYAKACERGDVKPGHMLVFETGALTPQLIVNFPTKRHWRGKSRIEDIQSGLEALVAEIRKRHINSIAIPPLGSGLGGLDWRQVRPLIENALAQVPEVEAIVFEPSARPEPVTASAKSPNLTAGRAALVGLIGRYLAGMMDTSITLLEVHKLMYFLQRAGEPLRLNYTEALYGPYAENLRHVLAAINGHLITGFAAGDDPTTELELVPGALERARAFLAERTETNARFERVAELVDGFESPFGLELLATVDWVSTEGHASSPDAIRDGVYAWNARKQQFTPEQIQLAADRLQSAGFKPIAA